MTEREIFVAAFQRTDPDERASYLDEACGPDLGLRCRIEDLLRLAEGAGSFLEEPPDSPSRGVETATIIPGEGSPTADNESFTSGNVIAGKYKLVEVIGEGGMGVVYLAQQIEPVKRLVALKVIKAGMDSRQVLARFEAERQALALMDHPNIARVLDAGATGSYEEALATGKPPPVANASGPSSPYFVMELVKGVPITKFCDERKLTPRERLELFLPVCHAIQHAHHKGIIHRDLKPTNVLVALYDGQPVPKVIDFGVAKAAGLPLTERTLVTGFGALVGTPEYMSPEQAQLNQLDIDTRSDIYGLGVLLYELLTGTTPLTRKRMKEAALLEVLRVIREEEAQKPSTRLSTTDELPSIAANRGTEPARLSRLVRGELDWIVMKSLEKDRARRYDTAGEFAADVRRYLADEPVQACPPSSWYRFRKFARRKKGLLVATSLVSLALVAGIIGTTWAMIDARSQHNLARAREEQARSAEAEAKAVLQFFERRILSATRPKGQGRGLGREATIGNAVDNAEPAIAEAFADKPLAEASIRRALGLTYWYMGDYAKAIAQHERALALRRAHLGAEHPDTLNSMTNLGQAYQSAGRLTDALPLYEETLKLRKAVIGPTDTETLWTMNRLAGTLVSLGRTEDALPIYEEALSIARTTLGPDHTDTLIYLDKLADGYRAAGRLAESLQLFEEALKLYEAKLPPEHPDRLATMGNVALVRCDFGRWAEAIPMLQKALELKRSALGPTHPETLIGLHNLGVAHRDFGQAAEALPILEEAVKLHTARMGADHHLTLIMVFNLAWLYRDTGRLEEALALFQETLRLQLVKLSADHPRRLLVMNHTGDCLMRMKKYTEADTLLRECLALRTRKAPGEWWVSHTKSQLGRVATSLKRHAEAEPLLLEGYRELLASKDKLPARHRPYVSEAAQGVVDLYDAMGNKNQAAEWHKKLEAHRKETGGKDP